MLLSTKPLMASYDLPDSSVALAAFIAEKILGWSERDIPLDTIITNNMLYWLTNTGYYAARVCWEATGAGHGAPQGRVMAPTRFAFFPHDISHLPREYVHRFFNVTRFTHLGPEGISRP